MQEFEIDQAINQIREDFARDRINAECMEREIDFALRGMRGDSQYLPLFRPFATETVPR